MLLVNSPIHSPYTLQNRDTLSLTKTFPQNIHVSSSDTVNRLLYSDLGLHTTSIKLPQFWSKCPETWFTYAEMQFSTKGITSDKTKYECIVLSLPQEVLITIIDFIRNPPTTDLYIKLKKTLIEHHSSNEESRLEKILSGSEMGQRKTSEFCRSLSLLAGTNFSSDILKKIWLRKLPNSLNVALTDSDYNDIDKLLRQADEKWQLKFDNESNTLKIQ